MPHTRYSEKFYWLIHKSDHPSEQYVTIGMSDESNSPHRNSMYILGYEEPQSFTQVKTHYHIIEMIIPNEILKFKAIT